MSLFDSETCTLVLTVQREQGRTYTHPLLSLTFTVAHVQQFPSRQEDTQRCICTSCHLKWTCVYAEIKTRS